MVAYSFKRRFVDPIRVGLGILTSEPKAIHSWRGFSTIAPAIELPQPKTQTIRAVGKRRHARTAETLQLYCGQRSSSCFLIGVAQCRSVESIELWLKNNAIDVKIDRLRMKAAKIDEFIRADGLKDVADMLDFWKTKHPGVEHFKGFLVKWLPSGNQSN
jgi:hypothetical protein